MKKDTGITIRNCLKKISGIINKTASKSQIARNRSIYAIAEKIKKLGMHDLPEQMIYTQELAGEALEKVSYYMDLSLRTFQKYRGNVLEDGQQANFIFALSETYETLGNYRAALTNYNNTLDLAIGLKNQSMQGKVQYRIARIYSERGDWQKAQDLLEKSIVGLEGVGNHAEAALAQIELGKIAYRKGEYLQAQDIFQRALQTSERISDIRSRAEISNHLGVIRRMVGDYDLAYKHFQEALIEFQSIQEFRGTAESLNNLGQMHLRRENLQLAFDYFEKAQELCQEIGYFPLVAFVHLNKAEFYTQVGDYPMAANTCGRALEFLVRLKNPVGIAKTNLLFGRIFRKAGDAKTAEEFYHESMRLYEEFDIQLGLANCYREFAQLLEDSGRGDESAAYNRKAEKIFNNLKVRKWADDTKKHSDRAEDFVRGATDQKALAKAGAEQAKMN